MIFIKEKLKKFREDLGFTQETLGAEIGLSKPAYSNIETGNRNGTVITWLKIQKALGLSNDELVEAMKEDLFF